MFESYIHPEEVIISDDKNTNIFPRRRARGLFRRDFNQVPYQSSAYTKELDIEIIQDRNKIIELAEEQESNKNSLYDLLIQADTPSKNQGQIPYCWIYAAVGAMESLNVVKGNEYEALSACHAGSKITGFVSRGGFITDSLEYLSEKGVCSEKFWPDRKISRQYDTEEARIDALNHRYKEWYELPPRNLNYVYTCLLNRIPVVVGLNWWRHAIYYVGLVIKNGKIGIRFRNSWSNDYGYKGYGVLFDSKQIPDECFAPRAITN